LNRQDEFCGRPEGRPEWRSWPIDDPGVKFLKKTFGFSTKKEKSSKKERKGRPVETATAVEIEIGGLRHLLLDDFHELFEKASATNRSGFFTVTTDPAAVHPGLLFK
jgi:hypothetical protein